jgi:hypothetical protein
LKNRKALPRRLGRERSVRRSKRWRLGFGRLDG